MIAKNPPFRRRYPFYLNATEGSTVVVLPRFDIHISRD